MGILGGLVIRASLWSLLLQGANTVHMSVMGTWGSLLSVPQHPMQTHAPSLTPSAEQQPQCAAVVTLLPDVLGAVEIVQRTWRSILPEGI